LAPVVEGTVALLAQSPYLRLALSPEVMRGQWAARLLDPAKLADQTDPRQDADVLCLESSFLQSKEARKLLWRYLSNGRGVLLLVNRVTPTIDGCLRELGFQADGVVTASDARSEQFQFVFSNHPIFHPFASPDYGNLMEVQVSQYARLKAAQATPLIFGENGAALFFQSARFSGKLFLAAFGLDREHTSWPIHQTFIPFLDLTLQTARAEDPTPTAFEPGEIATIQLPTGGGAREVVLRDEQREVARAAVEQGRAQVRMPDKPGLYSLTRDNSERVEKLFSVNPSPKESQLAYVDSPEAIKSWRLERPVPAAKTVLAAPMPTVRLAGILQQQLWWWMVLAGLSFLMLEMALAAVKKESA
ncbi:MAG TPA: hypothetical protein VNT26_23255, partial [Candidatus Sulfotelmatobacter sp.]|nr:hypothetical protein [Candidatus Sulfotelmatobacter sp.]